MATLSQQICGDLLLINTHIKHAWMHVLKVCVSMACSTLQEVTQLLCYVFFQSVCISPLCSGSEKNTTHEETGSSLGSSGLSSLTVSHKSELDCAEASDATDSAELCDQDVVAVFETSLVPVVEVEMAQLPCSLHESPCKVLAATQLKEAQEHEGSDPGVSECSGTIAGSSTVSFFRSGGPQVIRCLQVASCLSG